MTKTNKGILAGAGLLALLLLLAGLFFALSHNSIRRALSDTAGSATVTRYYTYGIHFQLEGTVEDEQAKDVNEAALLLRKAGFSGTEVERLSVPFTASKEKVTFRTAKKINEGLCMETLNKGTSVALLELTYKDGTTRVLSLQDETGEDPIEYYTLAYHHRHRKITTEFQETLLFHTKSARLPADVYDVVVDPGHGGKDPGAQAAGYNESDVVLDLGKALKTALEREGYKVLLTRDGAEDPEVNFAYTAYDKDGRVNRTLRSKAKFCFSLHLNQNNNNKQNGIQIYRSTKAGNGFAKAIATNLTEQTALPYSNMSGSSVPGVYSRTFTNAELREERAKAKQKGFSFYNATTSTDYYFMVREYGGLATGAYVDGRNPDYGVNEYRNSNQGVESCLCELGFLSNGQDRQTLLNNKRGIASALTNALTNYLKGPTEPNEEQAQTVDLLAKENL